MGAAAISEQNHTMVGTIGWPVPFEPGDDGPHASTQVCERAECQDAASRWVREATGHDGVYRSFGDARAGRSGCLIPVPFRVACMTCTSTIDRDRAKGEGWLVDEYPTPGGVPIKIAVCFPCRQKGSAREVSESTSCDRSCGGDYKQPDGWRATCEWLGHCDDTWSCWDEDCVREWADEHGAPDDCETCHRPTYHEVTVKQISELQQAVAGVR